MTGVFKCSSLYGAFVATGHMPIFGKLTCLNSTSKLPSLRYMLATYNLGTHTCIYTWLGVFVPPWTCSGTYHLHSMCILLATCTSSTLGIPIFNVFFFFIFFSQFYLESFSNKRSDDDDVDYVNWVRAATARTTIWTTTTTAISIDIWKNMGARSTGKAGATVAILRRPHIEPPKAHISKSNTKKK